MELVMFKWNVDLFRLSGVCRLRIVAVFVFLLSIHVLSVFFLFILLLAFVA